MRARSRMHLSTPALRFTRSPATPRGGGAPRGPAGLCTDYSTKGGRPRKTDAGEGGRTGQLRRSSLSPSASPGEGVAAGAVQEFSSCPSPPGPAGAAARGARRHMMAQRLRRSAPWKRRAACTCLQRAQPTLLSSSLKSSRMCQLYLAEHST